MSLEIMQAAPISSSADPAAATSAAAQAPFSAAANQSPFPALFQWALGGASQPQIAAQRVPDRGRAQDSARAWGRSTTASGQSAGTAAHGTATSGEDATTADPFLFALQIALSGAATPVAPVSASVPDLGSPAAASVAAVNGSEEHSAPSPGTDAGAAANGTAGATSVSAVNTRLTTDFSQAQAWFAAGADAANGTGARTPQAPRKAAAASPNTFANASPVETTPSDSTPGEATTQASRNAFASEPPTRATSDAATATSGSAATSVYKNEEGTQAPEPIRFDSGRTLVRAFGPAAPPIVATTSGNRPIAPVPEQNRAVQTAPQTQPQPQAPATLQQDGLPLAAVTVTPESPSASSLMAADPSNSSVAFSVLQFAVQQTAPDAGTQAPSAAAGTSKSLHEPFSNAVKGTSGKTLAPVGSIDLQASPSLASAGSADAPVASRPPSKFAGNDAQDGNAKGSPQHATAAAGSRPDATDASPGPDTAVALAAGSPTPAASVAVASPTVAAMAASQTPQTSFSNTSSSTGSSTGSSNSSSGHAGSSANGATPSQASNAAPSSPSAADAASPTSVNLARLMDRGGQTEMRIEMQSDSLGGVELRARMTGDQVGAAIVVERHDIHSALSNELPALHSALVEKNVRVQTLSISQGTQTLLGDGSGTEMSGRGFERPRPRAQATGQSEGTSADAGPLQEWTGPATVNGRLSVRA